MLFPDFGLHVAVLGSLLREGVIDAAALEAVLEGINPEPGGVRIYDLDEERRRFRQAEPRLHELDLPDAAVGFVKEIDFDGGNSVYMAIERILGFDTGGESEYYRLHSLEGAGALTSLERLDLDSYGYNDGVLDLLPLAGLPSLQRLRLTGRVSHSATLATLPRLQQVNVDPQRFHADRLLARLAERGVTIKR